MTGRKDRVIATTASSSSRRRRRRRSNRIVGRTGCGSGSGSGGGGTVVSCGDESLHLLPTLLPARMMKSTVTMALALAVVAMTMILVLLVVVADVAVVDAQQAQTQAQQKQRQRQQQQADDDPFLRRRQDSRRIGPPCQTDQDCQLYYSTRIPRLNTTLPIDSFCQFPKSTSSSSSSSFDITGTCSNPFQQGCLRTLLGEEEFQKRVCNSADSDSDSDNSNFCRWSDFEGIYPELRVHNGDWESSIITSWIMQIVLSEFVQVPTSVGLNYDSSKVSGFYASENTVEFSTEVYPWEAMEIANSLGPGGCTTGTTPGRRGSGGGGGNSTTILTEEEEQLLLLELPCVDVIPEVWQTVDKEYTRLLQRDVIDIPVPSGVLGTSGLRIPLKTLQEYPSFAIWLGLATGGTTFPAGDGGTSEAVVTSELLSEIGIDNTQANELINQLINANNGGSGTGTGNETTTATTTTDADLEVTVSALLDILNRERQQLIAGLFKRPTTWGDYCNEVSSTQCIGIDGQAVRPPLTDEEASMYFVDGLYYGHFRFTSENNCTQSILDNEDVDRSVVLNCSGHVGSPPCDWGNPVESRLFWNNITALQVGGGPLEPAGMYTGEQLRQIWHAANYTKSHVLMHWYGPDTMPIEFIGTDYEMQPITFPVTTFECLRFLPTPEEICSPDPIIRLGDPRGSCQTPVQTLFQLMTKSLASSTYTAENADRSPAYEMIRGMLLTTLDVGVIMQQWYDSNSDTGGDARTAVCHWVANNIDRIEQQWIPPGFPRVKVTQSQYGSPYHIAGAAFGIFVGLYAIIAILLIFRYRNTKTMIFTQPFFMAIICFGFLMIAAGGILWIFEPTHQICIATAWIPTVGYTIELTAVLVKTSAINHMIKNSKKNKRVKVSRKMMLLKISSVVIIVAAILTAWTIINPPTPQEQRILDEETGTVTTDLHCESEDSEWRIVTMGFQIVLLVMAVFLAFQTRDVMQQLNESISLAIMCYSQFVFMIMSGILTFFYVYDVFPASTVAAAFSFILSIDAFVSMSIYISPKIYKASKAPTDYKPGRFSTEANLESLDEISDSAFSPTMRSIRRPAEVSELKILVCSANLGNAEPTSSSVQAWVPLHGEGSGMTPLDEEEDNELYDAFDIIAIGMQEATWTDQKPSMQNTEQNAPLTEEDVLNMLEEQNTARMRELVQSTLGAGYTQLEDRQRGQMRLHIWVRRAIWNDIVSVESSGANTGIGNVLANKGGIVVTLKYKTTTLSFVSAHLAAHEGESYYKARCDNISSILSEAKTSPISRRLDVTMSSSHVFFFGDLNFRTKFDDQVGKSVATSATSTASDDGIDDEDDDIDDVSEKVGDSKVKPTVIRAKSLVKAQDYRGLYKYDELHKAVETGDCLVEFTTLPCDFPPTFKVQRAEGFEFKDQRTPSYTDRILFKSSVGLKDNLRPLSYEACPDFITSDHKPIRGAFGVIPNHMIPPVNLTGKDLSLVFRKLRCHDLLAADNDGLSDPYLVFLWSDDIDLQFEGGKFADRIRDRIFGSLMTKKRRWPRTEYVSKTLDPIWKATQVSLSAHNTTIGAESMLYIAVVDYDAFSQDDCIGLVALNAKELLESEDVTTATATSSKKALREIDSFDSEQPFDTKNRRGNDPPLNNRNESENVSTRNNSSRMLGGGRRGSATRHSITRTVDVSKTVKIDRPVIWEGKPAGRFKCKVDITITGPAPRHHPDINNGWNGGGGGGGDKGSSSLMLRRQSRTVFTRSSVLATLQAE